LKPEDITIFTIDGVWSSGEKNVDVFGKELRLMGCNVVDVDMPKDTPLTAQIPAAQKRRARVILDHEAYVPGRTYVIAHSNGCQLALWAGKMDGEFAGVFLFNPAMSKTAWLPHHFAQRIYVIYSPHDTAILLGAWMPGFGLMGRHGYRGPTDRRVRNVVNDQRCNSGWNHSCAFKRWDHWGPFILREIDNVEALINRTCSVEQ